MNEDFVSYELAVKLEEKGFNEPCNAYYEPINLNLNFCKLGWRNSFEKQLGVITAPTISQVLKWLREEQKIFVVIAVNPTLSTKDRIAYYYQVYSNSNGVESDYYESEECYAQWEDCAIGSIESVLKYLI